MCKLCYLCGKKIEKNKTIKMKKYLLALLAIVLVANITKAQPTNFSGTWTNPNLEMISGIQYANAVPKQITVTQTKDSIKLETVSAGNDGDVTSTQTIALNGKQVTRVGKTSKRTIQTSATWSNNGKTLTFITTISYADKPKEAEYKNTEVWELTADGTLIITKTSDATVTDDWTIKAEYSKE
jgi:hypothetical protein